MSDALRDVPRPSPQQLVSAPLELANVALVVGAATLVASAPTPVGVSLVFVMAFDLVVLWGCVAMFVIEKRGLPAEDAEHYSELSLDRSRMLTRFVEWIVLGANASLASALFLDPTVTIVLTFVAVAGPIVAFLPPLTRLQREMRRIAGTNVPGTDLSRWRAGGLVYWAPDDPSIVVPKRIGIGSTLNMAHPVSWILIGAAIVIPLLISLLTVASLG